MKKNILVVDDSALMRRIICDIINSDIRFKAEDKCRDGLEAYETLQRRSYDAVVLDVNMPRMDGLQLLEKLQKERKKVTVIVASTLTTKDAETTILAMERGAVDFVTKPGNIVEAKTEDFKETLLNVLAAVLKVENKVFDLKPRKVINRVPHSKGVVKGQKLVALACSTGGPKALQQVIPFLPAELDAPVVLVQHMPAGFTNTMAERLNTVSKVKVKEAEDGDILQKGCVYVAPGGKHMEIMRMADGRHKVALNTKPPVGGLRPYANYMYASLKSSEYAQITCVVLTGMGADGTSGIMELAQKKSIHVISQDEKSCIVYGMPKAVVEAGLSDEVASLRDVAQAIIKNVGVR